MRGGERKPRSAARNQARAKLLSHLLNSIMSGGFLFGLAAPRCHGTGHMAETDCRTYLRVARGVSHRLCAYVRSG